MQKKKIVFDNKGLLGLLFPLIIEQLLAVTVGLADSIMVAKVGEGAVSAVSLVDSINILIINIFAALATGGAVVAGQYLGRKEPEKSCKSGEQLILFVTITSVLVMLLIYLGKSFILNILFGNVDPIVSRYCNTYLLIVSASIPFIALYNAGAALFRAMGNSNISMKTSLLMNGINIVLNAVCIYGFDMEVEGVAYPTLISRIIAAIVILYLLRNKELLIHFDKYLRVKLDKKMIKKILHIGVPNGIENSMFQLGKIMLLSLIASFGTVATTANAVSNTIACFQILPGLAIGLGLITVVSHCVGANDYNQVRYYTKKLLKFTYIAMIGINILIVILLPTILNIYGLSTETAKATKEILILHGVCACLIWPISFTLPNTLRAANDARYTMIISVLSMWIFRIVFGIVLGKYFNMGVLGVWIAMIIDWCIRSLFFILRYKGVKWEKTKI